MKRNIIISVIFVFVSCGTTAPAWEHELAQRNPFANDSNYVSVYFRFDTIVNGYDVRGIYFPSYREEDKHDRWHGWFYESGIIMYFRNIATGRE